MLSERELAPSAIGIDRDGWPTHCGERMQNDWDMRGCLRCNHYITTDAARGEARAQGIALTYRSTPEWQRGINPPLR